MGRHWRLWGTGSRQNRSTCLSTLVVRLEVVCVSVATTVVERQTLALGQIKVPAKGVVGAVLGTFDFGQVADA